jgi:predicted polyphosphate/ATP-dependent NAD kinase
MPADFLVTAAMPGSLACLAREGNLPAAARTHGIDRTILHGRLRRAGPGLHRLTGRSRAAPMGRPATGGAPQRGIGGKTGLGAADWPLYDRGVCRNVESRTGEPVGPGGPRALGREMSGPLVGIIANPVSARDIRRVIANATALQITDRANIVLRVLACLKATGVTEVVMMPENGGIRQHVRRGIDRAEAQRTGEFPTLAHLDWKVTGTVDDTIRAAAEMRAMGCAAIVVLGGDGTHRAVVSACGSVPVAGISTGTNNAFPEHREPTVTGLAVGLAVTGKVPAATAFVPNKLLTVSIGGQRDIALVDLAIVTDLYVGARALWRTESFRELFVTFADPEVIGMSAIAGLIERVGREEPDGLHVMLSGDGPAAFTVRTPLAPGYIRRVGIESWRRLPAGERVEPSIPAGTIALDGERELAFGPGDAVGIVLERDAFRTVDCSAVMRHAARHGLMREASRLAAAAI